LERKKVLVTGASSGIGAATARRFAAEGWDVCLTSLDAKLLEEVKSGLPAGNHLSLAGDYTQDATIQGLEALIRKQWQGLEALVNCAGIFHYTETANTPLPEWRRTFDVMLDGGMKVTRLALPFLKQDGRIIHVTSIHQERAAYGASAYAMAKAALAQYCRALAEELAPRGILANAIAPGFVDTPMSRVDGVNELESDWFRRDYVEGPHLPLRRAAKPEEIAGVAFFLAGPDSSYITGQTLTVDGGLTITF
jgi:NAD(P)-dependent dehydrogenase (short-subunit alcohol dehydrogenase family)